LIVRCSVEQQHSQKAATSNLVSYWLHLITNNNINMQK